MIIGDKNIGVQEIPSLNQYVIAIDVLLGKNNLETGITITTLYKRYDTEAIKIDEAAIDISKLSSNGQIVNLEFGLSLEQINKTQSYYLEIKAPQNSNNTITWYGSINVDNLTMLYNETAVAREAGYATYKSNLHTLSNHVQIDGNYMLIHAWAQFVNGCKKTAENQEFIKKSYPIIKRFSNYYINQGYINDEFSLMKNDSFEYSRDGRYWKSYDLITNVFASQALHELSVLAEGFGDRDSAIKWANISTTLTKGINEYLKRFDFIKPLLK